MDCAGLTVTLTEQPFWDDASTTSMFTAAVAWGKLPLLPVTVIVAFPTDEVDTVMVEKPMPVIEGGLKLTELPIAGSPLALRLTVPLKPSIASVDIR